MDSIFGRVCKVAGAQSIMFLYSLYPFLFAVHEHFATFLEHAIFSDKFLTRNKNKQLIYDRSASNFMNELIGYLKEQLRVNGQSNPDYHNIINGFIEQIENVS